MQDGDNVLGGNDVNTLVIISGEPSEALYTLSKELTDRGEAVRFLLREKNADLERLAKIGDVYQYAVGSGYDHWVRLICESDRIISWR